uniref:Uncharacterized protein n=1 Tax=Anopheles quadriannulatus TaxID=34691 RepID=A0A182XQI5_ANOQN
VFRAQKPNPFLTTKVTAKFRKHQQQHTVWLGRLLSTPHSGDRSRKNLPPFTTRKSPTRASVCVLRRFFPVGGICGAAFLVTP